METFYQIPLSTLKVSDVKKYDVYIQVGDNYILFLKNGYPFSNENRNTLMENNHKFLFVKGDELAVYYEDLQQRVNDSLFTQALPNSSKANILYKSSIQIMKHVFDSPTHESLKIAEQSVKTAVDFILNEPSAISHLINITEHDYYTYTHSVNVGVYSLSLSNIFFGSNSNVDYYKLGMGFFLHDLGKSKIDLSILNKKGPLTEDEWRIMKRHPKYSYDLLIENNYLFKEAAFIALQHHEKYDGSGYPKGLAKEQIHILAQICTIADVFDALTTKRSYKDALNTFQALKLMKDEMSNAFNPRLFMLFIELFTNSQKR